MEYNITEKRRLEYKRASAKARRAKEEALAGNGPKPVHGINTPNLDPNKLMPQAKPNGHKALSLFSGGGGLDLGFDRAGFEHVASYEILDIAGKTLKRNRRHWRVFHGKDGDVSKVDWTGTKEKIDVIHGGPPCQPFSIAGQRRGPLDKRDMWPEFSRAIDELKPQAFVAENVPGLLDKKFGRYVDSSIIKRLGDYTIKIFSLNTSDFGVPQQRTRIFFVGFKNKKCATDFREPQPTHIPIQGTRPLPLFHNEEPKKTKGARHALGLPDGGTDGLAPTIRSAFTGKRNTTSVLNSKASQKQWNELGLWPNGVQSCRQTANAFATQDGTFRMSVQDVALLQGFPEDWIFEGAVYQVLGQIGNSVSPVVAYRLAAQVAKALGEEYTNLWL